MGFFSSDSDQAQNYDQVYNGDSANKGSWTHEAIGGAAAFAAVRAYENHQQAEGKPASHALAKELLGGLLGAELDKLAETKGLDEFQKIEAQRHAKQQAEEAIAQDYQ